MLDSLKGKVAVVTGGAMGIGYGIVKRFAEYGVHVLLVDREGEHAESAAGKLKAIPGKVVVFKQDVTEEGAGDRIVERCIKEFGTIDILVNDAGDLAIIYGPILKTTPENFDENYKVFLKAVVFLSKAAAEKMVEQKKPGKIINIASGSAFFPIIVGFAAYEASKAGVVMFTKSLALELAPYGITVNAIAPGSAQTEGAFKMWQAITLPEEEKQQWALGLSKRMDFGRQSTPDDIAKAVLFLASTGSDYMTGETIMVDGGFSLTITSKRI